MYGLSSSLLIKTSSDDGGGKQRTGTEKITNDEISASIVLCAFTIDEKRKIYIYILRSIYINIYIS